MKTSKLICCLLAAIILHGCKQVNYTGAVVTGHPEATKIGIQVLEDGGNAIDASIARHKLKLL